MAIGIPDVRVGSWTAPEGHTGCTVIIPPEGYLKRASALTDPWGADFQYESPGQHNPHTFDLWSLGPDGKGDTADDIRNW